MRLTLEQLEEAFLDIDKETIGIFKFRSINRQLKKEDSIDLREVLVFFRNDKREVSVFVEKILRTSDIDDVDYVIELLTADIKDGYSWSLECWCILQAWKVKSLMQFVIEKRTVLSRVGHDKEKGIV